MMYRSSVLLLPLLLSSSLLPNLISGEDGMMMIGGPSGTLGAGLVDPELMDTMMSTGMAAIQNCGIDMAMLGMANQMTYGAESDPFAPLRKFAESMKKTCTKGGDDEVRFKAALTEFESCSEIDLIDYMEYLPSAIVGTLEDCLDMFVSVETSLLDQFQANPMLTGPDMSKLDIEFTQQCFNAYFGNNVFGNANRRAMLSPERTIGCFADLSKALPDCTYHVWPIPIVGSILRQVACLLGNVGPIMEKAALLELRKLDSCLPTSFSDSQTCDGIRSVCLEKGSSLFMASSLIKSFSGMPLTDEYVKVAQSNNLPTVLGKYEEFNKKCSGHDWERLVDGINAGDQERLVDGPNAGDQAPVPRIRNKTSDPAPNAPMSSTSSESSSSGGGGGFSTFFGGMAVGLVVAGVAWGFLAKQQRARNYENVGYQTGGSSFELS